MELESPFDNILNFRDVGRTVNEATGTEYIAPVSFLSVPWLMMPWKGS